MDDVSLLRNKKKATQGSSPEENLSLSFSLLYKSCYLSVWFLIVAVVQVVVRQPCAKVVQISPVVTPVGTHEWNSVGNFFLLANQMGKRPTCCHETNWNRIQTGYQRDIQQRAPSAPAAVSIPSCKFILQFPIIEWTMKIHWQLFFFWAFSRVAFYRKANEFKAASPTFFRMTSPNLYFNFSLSLLSHFPAHGPDSNAHGKLRVLRYSNVLYETILFLFIFPHEFLLSCLLRVNFQRRFLSLLTNKQINWIIPLSYRKFHSDQIWICNKTFEFGVLRKIVSFFLKR